MIMDRLLTHNGKFQKIINIQRKIYNGDLFDIKIKYHPELITTTEEHPFYIREKIGEEKFTRQETLLYVETPAKEAKERGMFGKKQQGFETGLEQIKESVAKPQKNKKNQSVEKIWERIGRLKQKYSGIGQA